MYNSPFAKYRFLEWAIFRVTFDVTHWSVDYFKKNGISKIIPTCVQSKSGGRLAPAKFDDELALFTGAQDLQTIVRADYQPHSKVTLERPKPKDQIEVKDFINQIL